MADREVAHPSLYAFVSTVTDDDAARFMIEMSPQFANALARIRTELPALSLGFQVVSTDRHRWLGFEPTESPRGTERGLNLSSAFNSTQDALGWDGGRGLWIAP